MPVEMLSIEMSTEKGILQCLVVLIIYYSLWMSGDMLGLTFAGLDAMNTPAVWCVRKEKGVSRMRSAGSRK